MLVVHLIVKLCDYHSQNIRYAICNKTWTSHIWRCRHNIKYEVGANPGARSPCRLNILQWKLAYVGTQYGNVWEGKQCENFLIIPRSKNKQSGSNACHMHLTKSFNTRVFSRCPTLQTSACKHVITNGETPRTNCSKNSQNLFQLWFKSYRMSFPEITNYEF